MTALIVQAFQASAQFQTMDEVDLFQLLAKTITNHTPSVFIDETHGKKCQVEFDFIDGHKDTCEISDLLIVAVGPEGDLRATFWQAKKEKKSKWVAAGHVDKHLDFDGQFNQWDLLARRPNNLKGLGNFNPPIDILSSFTSASIGSYGVFYPHGHVVELCHSVAQFVSTSHYKKVGKSKARMTLNGYLSPYGYQRGEAIVRTTLETFLDALLSHRVGALLSSSVDAHRWLAVYAKKKMQTLSSPATPAALNLISSFDQFLAGQQAIPDIPNPQGDGLSILIVGGQP